MAHRKNRPVVISRRSLGAGAGAALAVSVAVWAAGNRQHTSAAWFYTEVIVPTLKHLELDPHRRAPLLLGTALVETNLADVTQQPGPALGYFQMEPNTYAAIWEQLRNYPAYARLVTALLPPGAQPSARMMVVDASYACGMAAVLYEAANRFRASLPAHGDVTGQANYWKAIWNTPRGKGTVANYLARWQENDASTVVAAIP